MAKWGVQVSGKAPPKVGGDRLRGEYGSVRSFAVVWGSAFAFVAGFGVGGPAAESAAGAPTSNQAASIEKADSFDWWDVVDRWFKKPEGRWTGGSRWDDGNSTDKPAPAKEPAQTAGWPTAATTGVPDGVSLTSMNGLTVKADGAVIDAKLVKGDIVINADNVTIKNSKVEGRIQIRPPYKGLMVQSTEIAGPGTAAAAVTEGIGYANFTCDRCDIHGWGKGAMMDANVTISNSWIHDMPVAPGSHNEAILSLGGYNYNIIHNRLDSGGAGNFTASLAFLNQWNSFTDTLVKDNLFNGGGYCVYAGGAKAHNAKYPSSNVRFIDNTFGTDHGANCGQYGPAVAWDASGHGSEWSGNVMSDGTEVRTPSAG
jgi:hypothetical protein